MRNSPLLPPVTPPLSRGLTRGGIFDVDWIPPGFLDAARRLVPTNSPPGRDVSMDVFQRRVNFATAERSHMVTGVLGGYRASPMTPRSIAPYHTVPVPHGTQGGGIFGTAFAPMPNYPRVPQQRPQPPVLAGFGASPDGLGCGCGCVGSNC